MQTCFSYAKSHIYAKSKSKKKVVGTLLFSRLNSRWRADNKKKEAKQAYREPQFSLKIYHHKQLD